MTVTVEKMRTTPEGYFTVRWGQPEYTDWMDESMSWKETCSIGDWSFLWERRFKGPDALKLFSDISVNSFAKFDIGQAKHGRNADAIEVTLMAADSTLDAVKEAQDLGAQRVVFRAPAFEPEPLRKGMEKIANEIIAQIWARSDPGRNGRACQSPAPLLLEQQDEAEARGKGSSARSSGSSLLSHRSGISPR